MPILPENVVALGRIGGPLLDRNLKRKNAGSGEENLSFGNTSLVHPNVLYLDVINGRVGVNTDVPSQDFIIDTSVRTLNLIVPTQTEIANFVVTTNKIQNVSSSITLSPNQSTNPVIDLVRIGTYDYGSSVAYLNISDQLIENIRNNSNIELNPNGTGQVNINSAELYVDGDFSATGTVTWDGSLITLGSDDTDSVVFNADVNSNILPNINETYDLGTALKRWNKIYTKDFPVDNLILNTATINGVDMLLEQGNTIYVSIYGNDLNVGTHLHNTYRTVKHALSQAANGDTVVIFPGTYTEDFPLTVPAGVTVNGAGIRAVTISPTIGTRDKDAFLLNGETTVSNLSVIDFDYNSTNDTGYAFRLAPNIIVTSRSPYVQNCSAITYAPTAGRGALVDGSVANSSSKEASMLFHSVTMIVPAGVGVMATNGARVEWLDSFTYFAEKGIYLSQGTLGFASLGIRYGAEMRSIGSANIYGTYGAVADGANTIGYLINHNFAYIGTGTDYTNDPALVIQANEVVEQNNGKIYYESVDHKGDFRIGDIFYINQETGAVVFNAQSISFLPTGNITLTGPTSSTFIDYSMVQVSNIRIIENDILSLTGPINFSAFNGTTNLSTNVYVSGNTNISVDAVVNGNLYLGDQATDNITVVSNLTQDLLPDDVGGPYNLGSSSKTWVNLYTNSLKVDNVTQITNNTISILSSNTDLILDGSNNGIVKSLISDVQISNDLTVTGNLLVNNDTNFKPVEINGLLQQTGNLNQTGDYYSIGNLQSSDISVVSGWIESGEIKIQGTTISVTSLNNDLIFDADGTGGVLFNRQIKIQDNVISKIYNPLDPYFANIDQFVTEDDQLIYLEDNTDYLQADPNLESFDTIVLQPNGSGSLSIDSTKSIKIPVGNNTNRILSNNGEIRYNSTYNVFEGYQVSNIVSFNNLTDTDRNTYVRAGSTDNTLYFDINGSQKATINTTSLYTDTYHLGNLTLNGNTINNRISNNDLVFLPTGTGNTVVNGIGFSKDSTITNQLNQALTLKSSGIGYYSFAAASAIILPRGVSAERRVSPEVGETRFNTEKNYLEVYTGDITQGESGWASAIGAASEIIDANDIEDYLDIWTLVLG